MKNKLIYLWLLLITVLLFINLYQDDNQKYNLMGLRGTVDKLWSSSGRISVHLNRLHKETNETSWDEYVNNCLKNRGWVC